MFGGTHGDGHLYRKWVSASGQEKKSRSCFFEKVRLADAALGYPAPDTLHGTQWALREPLLNNSSQLAICWRLSVLENQVRWYSRGRWPGLTSGSAIRLSNLEQIP